MQVGITSLDTYLVSTYLRYMYYVPMYGVQQIDTFVCMYIEWVGGELGIISAISALHPTPNHPQSLISIPRHDPVHITTTTAEPNQDKNKWPNTLPSPSQACVSALLPRSALRIWLMTELTLLHSECRRNRGVSPDTLDAQSCCRAGLGPLVRLCW